MKQDTTKTDVLFLIEIFEDAKNDVFALFPNENYFRHDSDTKLCYAHIGQHSACHLDYAKVCAKATADQYKDLKKELESIGYNLNVLN